MIHYTLLPEKEIKKLKREYRFRIFIFTLFFMSCAIFSGVIASIPGFILSYTQEKEALNHLEKLQKNKQSDEVSTITKELASSSLLIKRLNSRKDSIVPSTVISRILTNKPTGVSVNSLDISTTNEEASTTAISVAIMGKSSTREVLVLFKDKLSADPLVSKVELPVSDLAKSKDISYSIRISINQIK